MAQQGLPGVTASWIGRAVVGLEALALVVWLAAPHAAGQAELTRPAAALVLLVLAALVGWPRLSALVRWPALALVPGIVVAAVASDAMAPLAGACLVLLSAALALGPQRAGAMTAASLSAAALGYVGVLGHLYGMTGLPSLAVTTAMAALTAPVVVVLCAAVLLSNPALPAVRALRAPGTAGELVRRLLGWTLLAPPLTVWVVTQASRNEWVDDAYGLSVMALTSTGGAVLLVVVGARTAARTDRAREAAARELAVLNAELSERVEAAVAEAEEGRDRLRFLLDSTPVGIFETGPDGVRRFVNQRWRELSGAGDVVGSDWVDVLHPDDRERVRQEWGAALASGDEYGTRCRYLGPDGGTRWVDIKAVAVRGADREVTRWLGCVVDVTDQVEATSALRRNEQQFRLAMEHAPIGMALVEVNGRFREVNRALCQLVGYDERELVGRTFQQITHPDDLGADLDNIRRLLEGSLNHYTMEKRYVTRDGDVVWVLLAVSLARDEADRPTYFIAQIQDITDARAAQERLAHRALHDPLTGLANRDLLMDHLSHALARSARAGTTTAVMFCDLDHFKAVNDTYGHEAGDLLLVDVADRLRSVVRPSDTVARLGGDEFVVVAEGLRDVEAVRALAERVRRSLEEPAQLGPHVVRAGASIGVAVAAAEDDARSVLRQADAAMYRAKMLGRGRLEMSGTPERRLGVVRQPPAVSRIDQHLA